MALRSSNSSGTKVLVTNLSKSLTVKDLKTHLMNAGRILSIRLIEKPTLQGIVEFQTKNSAEKAIRTLNKSKLNNCTINIQPYLDTVQRIKDNEEESTPADVVNEPLPAISTKLFIRNLNFDVTSEVLEKYMKKAGNIISCEVLRTKGGKSLGCGIVEYETLAESNNAMKILHNSTFHGRIIQLRDDRLEILETKHIQSSSSSSSQNLESFVPPEYQDHSVFIGNLSDFTTRDQLREHMSSVGEVIKSTILRGANDLSKNCGIVIYKNKEDAQKAIEVLNDTSLDDHLIFVREDRETNTKRPQYPRNSAGQVIGSRHRSLFKSTLKHNQSIYFSNLSFTITNDDVREMMGKIGEVNRVVIYEKGGQSLGMGVVEFCHPDSVEKACKQFHGKKIKDRKLLVRPYSLEKKKKESKVDRKD